MSSSQLLVSSSGASGNTMVNGNLVTIVTSAASTNSCSNGGSSSSSSSTEVNSILTNGGSEPAAISGDAAAPSPTNATIATTITGSPSSYKSLAADSSYNGGKVSKTNLYIRGLAPNTTDEDLFNLCSVYGNITSAKAIIDKATNQCRGYGFVNFETDASADAAAKGLLAKGIQAQMAKHQKQDSIYQRSYYSSSQSSLSSLSATSINYHRNSVTPQLISIATDNGPSYGSYPSSWANSNGYIPQNYSYASSVCSGDGGFRQQQQDSTNLYFANLPTPFREYDLEHLLLKYGNVLSTRILRDEDNVSKGVGFARMETRDECEKIIQNLNGMFLPGGKHAILIKFAHNGPPKRRSYNSGGNTTTLNTNSNNIGNNGMINGNKAMDVRLLSQQPTTHSALLMEGDPIVCTGDTAVYGMPLTAAGTALLATPYRYGPVAAQVPAAAAATAAGYTAIPAAHWVPQYIVHQPGTAAPIGPVEYIAAAPASPHGAGAAAASPYHHHHHHYIATSATGAGFIQALPYPTTAAAGPIMEEHIHQHSVQQQQPSAAVSSSPPEDYHQVHNRYHHHSSSSSSLY